MSSFPYRGMAPNFDGLFKSVEHLMKNSVKSQCAFLTSLMVSDPDSYVPQEVALGPYHYWRPELYEMERYKLGAARRTQKQLQNIKFQHLVEQLIKLESRIRSCYHK
uniref:Uncharacterized protein n=1 Tax=Solanum tuberosum TaxID=4113 RepID=M1B3Y9_SOLTU